MGPSSVPAPPPFWKGVCQRTSGDHGGPIELPRDFRPYAQDGPDGYEVSSDGVVRNVASGKVLAISLRAGRPSVKIGRTLAYLELVVARTWVPPDLDPARNCVLHEDNDGNNCRAENPRWATQAECAARGLAGRPVARRRGTAIEAFGDGIETVACVSSRAAESATRVPKTSIIRALDSGLPDRTGRCWRRTTPAVLPDEEWRELRECSRSVLACRYEVSNQGRARGAHGTMKPWLSGDYLSLTLRILDGAGNATPRHSKLRLLVATAITARRQLPSTK